MTDETKNIDDLNEELQDKKDLNSTEDVNSHDSEGAKQEESKIESSPEEIFSGTDPSAPEDIDKSSKEEIINQIPALPKESNYQISLINENLLRIRVSTVKSVNIDCSVKDKATPEDEASETQTNKIQIHPKPDNQPQEVEIIISIDPESGNLVVEKKKIIR